MWVIKKYSTTYTQGEVTFMKHLPSIKPCAMLFHLIQHPYETGVQQETRKSEGFMVDNAQLYISVVIVVTLHQGQLGAGTT